MNILSKSLLCAGMMVGMSMTANAYTLVSPTPGETTKVETLSSIKLVWDHDVYEFPSGTVLVYDSSNTQVATGSCDYDYDVYNAYVVNISPEVVTPGIYTVVVPANMADDNNNSEYRLTYEVEGAVMPTSCMPTGITPENGATIIQDLDNYVQFDQIRLDFANDKALTVDEAKISLRNQDNDAVQFTLGGWYLATDPMLQYAENPFVNINFNDFGDMPSGTYTFTALPGAFTNSYNVVNEETITAVYYYTKTKADADDTPLVIESALMGHVTSPAAGQFTWDGTDAVEVTPDMPVAAFIGTNNAAQGTGFLLTFNHGDKAEYVTYELRNVETSEILSVSNCIKQEDGTFLLGWPSTTKLFEGTQYALEFRAYNNIVEKVQFGNGASLTFAGTTEPFAYSSAKFITVVPSSGEVLTKLDQNKITVLFSEPVRLTAQASLGSGVSTPATAVSSNEEEYDYVWYVYIPDYIMKTYPDAHINVVAYGEDGRIVAAAEGGNGSIEENSSNEFDYTMTLCQPRVLTEQTNSHVAEIKTFSVYSSDGRGINTSWVAFPYLVNEKGETVAEINNEAYIDEWGDKVPFQTLVWGPGNEYERNPLVIEFQLTPAITEKGKYTLVFPPASFAIGTQFDADNSIEQEMNYWVTDFFPVTYTVDNNTIALDPVEISHTTNLDITVAEGWKLDALTLNGEDVTENVVNGKYTSPAADRAMAYEATFAFDGIVSEPSSALDEVTDLNLRAWSENGSMFVAGLKEGQIVRVYTAGGSLMTTVNVADADTMKFDAAVGVYIITVTEENNTVAIKLVNK